MRQRATCTALLLPALAVVAPGSGPACPPTSAWEPRPACLSYPDAALGLPDAAVSLLQKDVSLRRLAVESVENATGALLAARSLSGLANASKEPAPAAPMGIYPMSTAMICISSLLVQYFAIHTAWTIAHTVNLIRGRDSLLVGDRPGVAVPESSLELILQSSATNVDYAQMLSVLFIAVRQRATLLTGGQIGKYDLPQGWCQTGMVVCTVALWAAVVLHLIGALAIRHAQHEFGPGAASEGGGLPDLVKPLRWLAMVALYVSCIVVLVGLSTMQKPEALSSLTVPYSDTGHCIMVLTIVYFIIHLVNFVAGSFVRSTSRAANVTRLALSTTHYTPMLGVLLELARMRATQLNPLAPFQDWARVCFYVCTYSVPAQTVLTVGAAVLAGAKVLPGSIECDFKFEVRNKSVWHVLMAIKWIISTAQHVAIGGVVVSIFLLADPEGNAPPLSPTAKCVLGLTTQYFGIYIILWLITIAREADVQFTGHLTETFIKDIIAAKETLTLCPILCMLFIGARLRALEMTGNHGEPQGWAEDYMYLASWAVLGQTLVSVLLASIYPEESQKKTDQGCRGIGMYLAVLQFLALLLMYVGAIGVVVGVWIMTPETANGEGQSIPYPSLVR